MGVDFRTPAVKKSTCFLVSCSQTKRLNIGKKTNEPVRLRVMTSQSVSEDDRSSAYRSALLPSKKSKLPARDDSRGQRQKWRRYDKFSS